MRPTSSGSSRCSAVGADRQVHRAIRTLPLPGNAVHDPVAAFVLNDLSEPVVGLCELAWVTAPGGAILAAVFANGSGSAARGRIDAAAAVAGWQAHARDRLAC